MEKHSSQIQPTTTLLSSERENLQTQLRTTLSLSQNTHNTEYYRQALKNKYYQEYLQKFSVSKQATPAQDDNLTRVDNLIANKKKAFLQQIFESKQHKLPLAQQYNQKINPQPTTIESETNTVPYHQDETAQKSLIGAIMKTVMTMGKDTQGRRIYEGMAYRIQLWMKEGMQLLSVNRKTDKPQIAFSAYKDDDQQEFRVTENNLSEQETQRLIAFDKQHKQQPLIQDNHLEQDNGSELGD